MAKFIYGTCRGRRARQHIKDGRVDYVEFTIYEDGEDSWVRESKYWWTNFKPDDTQPIQKHIIWEDVIGYIITAIVIFSFCFLAWQIFKPI